MPLQDDMLRQMSATQQQVDGIIVPELADDLISPFLALPGLRGFWPMSAFQSNGDCFDQSGNGRLLTYNGNPTYNYDGVAPYLELDGTGDYLIRADEAGLDISGTETFVAAAVRGLTWGGWFYPGRSGVFERVFGKWGAAGSRSYDIWFTGADLFSSHISDDGTNTADDAAAVVAINNWYFVIGRFNPSTTLETFVNGIWTSTVTARASVFNSGTSLAIGASGLGGNVFLGRLSLCFLCAAYLSDAIISSLFQQTRAAFGV